MYIYLGKDWVVDSKEELKDSYDLMQERKQHKQRLKTIDVSFKEAEGGADAVGFFICLYVGASAFIREFQGLMRFIGMNSVELQRNSGGTAATDDNRRIFYFFSQN